MALQLAPRPGVCTRGTILEVLVNAFEIQSFPQDIFVHYDVISPHNARLAPLIIHRLQHVTAPDVFSRTIAVFDGGKNIFAQARPLFQQGAMTFTVNMSDDPSETRMSRVYNVTLTRVANVTPHDLMHVLQGQAVGMPTMTTAVQVLNVLVQQAARVRYDLHKKQRFYEKDGHDTFEGFQIWRGIFVSIRPTIGRLILNADMATGVLYQTGEMVDFVLSFLRERDPRALNNLNEHHPKWDRLIGLLKGIRVSVYPEGRTRTIRKLVRNAGSFEFPLQPGGSITVQEHYSEKYGYQLRFPHIPGIYTSREEVIPLELCSITKPQFMRKKTSPELTSRMLNFAKKRPEDRLNIVRRFMENMQLNNSPFIRQSGMVISPQPMEIRGRVLDPPPMVYGEGLKERPRAGAWNMVSKKLIEPMMIRKWAVVSFEPGTEDTVGQFAWGLAKAMQAVGMACTNQPYMTVLSPYEIEKKLKNLYAEQAGGKLDLLIAILPQNAANIRKAVKRFGDIDYGVPTQCVRVNKVMNATNQYLNNLILKINAKLGGANTRPSSESPTFQWFLDGYTMVVGADVTHPGPGILRPSVAALVASIDEGAAKYICRCSVQGPRTEIIEDLEGLMSYALKMFFRYRTHLTEKMKEKCEKEGKRPPDIPLLPKRIVFYRDGVSEGEIQKVVESEIKRLMDAVEKVYKELGAPSAYRAKLTFIVVGKRHHMRFIPKQGRGADRSGNAPAGLLVDTGITSPGIFDFYLLSHAGLLGTSRPTHYIVVKDDNGFDADRLQGFSFDLCHTYARATRSVSIPAPCYYADIACARADFHFRPDLNYEDDLSSTEGEFDMVPWLKGFANVNKNIATNMYFM